MTQEPTSPRYSEAFKRQVVQEHEAGMSISQLRRKYHIGGSMTIQKWVRQYGHKEASPGASPGRPTDQQLQQAQEIEALRQQVAWLEKAVAQLTLDKLLLESTLQLYQDTYGPELSKKNGIGSWPRPMHKRPGA